MPGFTSLHCPGMCLFSMFKRAFLVLTCVLATLAGAAEPAPPQVTIVSAEFGLFDASNPDELAFQPTLEVPHVVGQRYGWVIELRAPRRSVEVIEEYLIAGKPATVTTNSDDPVRESLAIPTQRRNRVSQRQLVPVDGRIYGEWGIGPQEPAGVRELQVTVEGVVAATFRYEVK